MPETYDESCVYDVKLSLYFAILQPLTVEMDFGVRTFRNAGI